MYVIKGKFRGETVYFVEFKDVTLNNSKWQVRICSSTIKGATKYETFEDAKKLCAKLPKNDFKVYPVCPMCHKEYEGYPALSRKDNKTKICQTCGVNQALYEFFSYDGDGKNDK